MKWEEFCIEFFILVMLGIVVFGMFVVVVCWSLSFFDLGYLFSVGVRFLLVLVLVVLDCFRSWVV